MSADTPNTTGPEFYRGVRIVCDDGELVDKRGYDSYGRLVSLEMEGIHFINND